jgi:O-antigen biosynthesis protein WbqP
MVFKGTKFKFTLTGDVWHRTYRQAQFVLKRLTDILLALTGLIVAAPFMVATAIAIKINTPGPALYKQRRIGRDGKQFDIYKFRTMFIGTPEVATELIVSLPDPVTRVGRILRQTSLDELPQLFNVLSGQMSIVGPRPALYNQTELTQKRMELGILKFLPGITGWAQVTGRDDLSDDVKIERDKWYCDHWNYWLDWKIIFLTISTVLSRKGAF